KTNQRLPVSENGFPATAEILLNLAKFGAKCSEVPLVLRYDLKEGRSSIKIIKTIFEYIRLIAMIKLLRRNDLKHKKILHIINIPWYSGLSRYAVDMARFMEYSGENVILAVVGNSPLYEKIKNLYEVIQLPGRGAINSIRGLLRLLKVRNDIKSVFAHTGSSCFIGFILSIIKRIPLIRSRSEKGRVKRNIFNSLIHKYVKAVVVPTRAIKNDFMDIIDKQDKIFMLPPVVDTSIFKISEIPENRSLSLVGRLDEVKGHKILIESLPEIKKECEGVNVFFVGKEEGV
ncbi:unnamed protein product, partial [marine sediment metagenome]